jgi:hypothetical protein
VRGHRHAPLGEGPSRSELEVGEGDPQIGHEAVVGQPGLEQDALGVEEIQEGEPVRRVRGLGRGQRLLGLRDDDLEVQATALAQRVELEGRVLDLEPETSAMPARIRLR